MMPVVDLDQLESGPAAKTLAPGACHIRIVDRRSSHRLDDSERPPDLTRP